MNTRGLLDQLLKSGTDLLQGKGASPSSPATGALGSLLSGAGGGALAAGAMGLLMGNKKARKIGGQALTYGGIAAVGVLAYKAWSNWQAQQDTAPREPAQTLDRLPQDQVEQHSQAVLKALIAAAKADGHVDARERELIEGQFRQLTTDPQLQSWLHAELNKPLDPVDVARAAGTPEMAAEMYLASVMMVDEAQFMERTYLDELARQLSLDAALKTELESQAKLAAAR